MNLSHPLCIDTTLLYHSRGGPLKLGLAWITRKWLGGLEPGGHNSEEGARAYIDLLRPGLRAVHSGLTFSSRDQVDNFAGLRPSMENS